ncbi:ATP-dependent Clp protease proteolytic subunit [Vibrio vulnificus]|nr:ATP-dependent Clp protease proteolytic subunit [Vibrio vulnificus]
MECGNNACTVGQFDPFFLLFCISFRQLIVQARVISYIIRVMIHQPIAGYYEAQIAEFVLEAEELLKLREIITRVYAQRTGKPLWVVSEDMERDVFMSATEGQAYGIVDLVAVA